MTRDADNAVRVRISSDRLQAVVTVQPGTDASLVTEQMLLGVATGRGLRESPELAERVAALAAAYDPASAEPFESLLAEGTPALKGEPSRFELAEDLAEIKERAQRLEHKRFRDDERMPTEDSAGEDAPDEGIDHYFQSTLMIVKPGQRLGTLHPATKGVDGIDVCGLAIAAPDGSPCSVTFDDSTVRTDAEGGVYATTGGLVVFDDQHLHVTETLEVSGAVDFSTGHITFGGDIHVHKGVCDVFRVKAERSLTIDGTAEACFLNAGLDLTLNRGMAGREKAEARAGRDLHARYIDAATVTIGRDLIADREVTNTTVTIGRRADCPHATLIGGELTVAGAATFQQVGSPAASRTTVRLGRIPELEALLRESGEVLKTLDRERTLVEDKLQQLRQNSGKLSASLAEELTELEFQNGSIQSWKLRLEQAMHRGFSILEEYTEATLTVTGAVLPGARVEAGTRSANIDETLQGPLAIELDEHGNLTVRNLGTGQRRMLTESASMDIDPARSELVELRETLRAA